MLQALKAAPVQEIFDRDPYESRRTALKGEQLLPVVVVYQTTQNPYLRGVVPAIAGPHPLQEALGGPGARHPLSTALAHRPVEPRLEAWRGLTARYGAGGERWGKKLARLALLDRSPLKLSLAAYSGAAYRQESGAAKLHAVREWSQRLPAPLVLTPGTGHDANPAVSRRWQGGWPYGPGRGSGSLPRRQPMRECRAPVVVRLKRGRQWAIVERPLVPAGPQGGGRRLRSDGTGKRAGWPEVAWRRVSARLPEGRPVRVLTARFDLTAGSVAQLYTERGKRENGGRWLKALLTSKKPWGESQTAWHLPRVAALVAALLWRVCKLWGRFPASLYEFGTRCQELSVVRITDVAPGAFRRALENIVTRLNPLYFPLQPL